MKVSTGEFIANYSALADKAMSEPVTITRGGQDSLVVISADEYVRLKRRDRRVVRLEDFTADEMAAIAAAEYPPGYEHLNEELRGWTP